MDLLLQYVDPLCELGGCQLLFLVVTGAKRRTPSATAEMRNVVNITHSSFLLYKQNLVKCLPDKWVCVRWRGRHFSVVQVLLALSVGVETRGQHWVAVFLQQLADQSSPGVGGQSGFLTVHALPLHWRVRWDWFWVTHKQTRFMLKCDTLSKMQTDDI